MKKVVFAIVGLLTSASCSRPTFSVQIEFAREENPSFQIITIEDAYQSIVVSKNNMVLTLGVESCNSCTKLKTELADLAPRKGISLFYIDVSEITETELTQLETITTFNDSLQTYKFAQNKTLPATYVFAEETIIVAFSSQNIANLDALIKVV